MKKKIITIAGFIIILLSGIIILYKNRVHYTMEIDGVKLALTLDNNSIDYIPKDNDYHVDINCANVAGEYLYDEDEETFKLSFKNMGSGAKCTLAFTSNPDTLIDIVEDEGYHETFSNDESYIDNLQTIEIDTTNFTITQGSPYGFEDDSGNFPGALKNTNQNVASSSSVITLVPIQSGGYNLCYTMSSEQNYDYAKIKIDGTELFNTKGKNTSTYTCNALGYLTSSNTIEVSYTKDSSTDSGTDTFSFYLQKGTYVQQIVDYDLGYRYEGQNPDNYIWFNNEMWRIIGSISTKINNVESPTTTNLVKIIRNEALNSGVLADKSSNKTWGTSSLYMLLNSYYYGAQNANNSQYCYAYSNVYGKCDYRFNGINPNGYYGLMIKDVYWNTGMSSIDYSAGKVYVDELSTQTFTGKIGLMNISDYGLATSYNRPDREALSAYNSYNYSNNNWLLKENDVWTVTYYSSSQFMTVGRGWVSYSSYIYASLVFPVVYLDPSLYVVSGDGSILNPYKIARPSGS